MKVDESLKTYMPDNGHPGKDKYIPAAGRERGTKHSASSTHLLDHEGPTRSAGRC